MATVSSYLLVIASGLVRDVYQRFVNPAATEHELRRLTYVVMIVDRRRCRRPQYLSGQAPADARRLQLRLRRLGVPDSDGDDVLLAASDRSRHDRRHARRSRRVVVAQPDRPRHRLSKGKPQEFSAYNLLGFEPLIWGLLASLVAGLVVSLVTNPPDEKLVSKLFDAPEAV